MSGNRVPVRIRFRQCSGLVHGHGTGAELDAGPGTPTRAGTEITVSKWWLGLGTLTGAVAGAEEFGRDH